MVDVAGARVRIEPLAVIHAEGLFAALDDERVGTYIGGPDVTTLDALRSRITRLAQGPPPERGETWLNWAALVDGTIVGYVQATLHLGIAEVAYVFGPAHWGKGLATEATALMIADLRSRGIGECWATVVPANTASIRLLARLGFVEADPGDLALQSYDAGDLTFTLR